MLGLQGPLDAVTVVVERLLQGFQKGFWPYLCSMRVVLQSYHFMTSSGMIIPLAIVYTLRFQAL